MCPKEVPRDRVVVPLGSMNTLQVRSCATRCPSFQMLTLVVALPVLGRGFGLPGVSEPISASGVPIRRCILKHPNLQL